jgi:uncharacterized protein YbcI
MDKSRQQTEVEVSEAVTRFEKEYLGRGPAEVKTYIIDDMVLVRLKGVLTQAEYQLAKSGEPSRGRELVKQVRVELIERGRPLIEAAIEAIVGKKVQSVHTDVSTRTGERILLFTLVAPPEFDTDTSSSEG